MKRVVHACLLVMTLLYPIVVYFGLHHWEAYQFSLLLLVIACFRWFSDSSALGPRWLWVTLLVSIALGISVSGQVEGVKVYPILVNAAMLVIFGWSLLRPPTVIERLARLGERDLPVEAIGYTRKVTIVWTIFFFINGSLATLTALWATDEVWMLYNGFIAYLLIGLLLAGERVVRGMVRGKHNA